MDEQQATPTGAVGADGGLRRIEATLGVERARLRQLIAASGDAVVTMDEDGLVVDWNPAAERMFGFSAREAIGARLSELIIPAAYRDRHEAGRRRYLRERQPRMFGRPIEIAALCRDGGELPVELSIWPLESSGPLQFGAFIRDISARRAVELALGESEDRYRLLVENLSEAILIVRDGRIVFANPSARRLTGLELVRMQQQPFTDFIHPDDREMVMDRHRRRLRGEQVEQHYSFRLLRPNGELLWVELAAVPLRWEGLPSTLSFVTDISERKRLEQSLRYSLEERDAMLASPIVGIAFVDADGRPRWANQALGRMLRIDRDDLLQTTLPSFHADEHSQRLIGEAGASALQTGRPFEAELDMRRAGGEPFHACLSVQAVNADEPAHGTVWFIIDIHRRQQLEHALQASSAEHDALLQSTLVGVGLLVDDRFRWVNRALADMLDRSDGELVGHTLAGLLAGRGMHDRFDTARIAAARRPGDLSGEHALQRRDGRTIHLRVHCSEVAGGASPGGMLCTFIDVSAARCAEQQARQLQRRAQALVVGARQMALAAQDARTPLAGILSSVETLRLYGDRLADGEKAELFEQIARSIEQMTALLDRMRPLEHDAAAPTEALEDEA